MGFTFLYHLVMKDNFKQSLFTKTVSKSIQEGQEKLADAIKTLVYQSDQNLFGQLCFENDTIFLEPLAFAWFNQPNGNSIPLGQILLGYLTESSENTETVVFADGRGIVYIPTIGHFMTNTRSCYLTLIWEQVQKAFTLFNGLSLVPHKFESIRYLPDTQIEVALHDNPLYSHLFAGSHEVILEMSTHPVASGKYEMDHAATVQTANLEEAWRILADCCPQQASDIAAVARRVVLFSSNSIWSFATVSAHGTAFLSCTEYDSVLFYIAELAHQFGHNVLNAALVEREKFFKVDPDKLFVSDWTGNAQDNRNLYSAFHGLYTTTKVAEVLDCCIRADLFTGRHKHVLIGRLADNQRRYKTGLEKAPHADLFTNEGQKVYKEMDELCAEIYNRNADLILNLQVANQPFVFDYPLYALTNPYPAKPVLLYSTKR
jgi:HEXXH motif-containing protein